jgi:hypothetical protein
LPNSAFQRFGLCQRGLFPAPYTVWKTVLSDAVAVIIRVNELAAVWKCFETVFDGFFCLCLWLFFPVSRLKNFNLLPAAKGTSIYWHNKGKQQKAGF